MKRDKESIARKFLKNEITWIVFIAGIVWAFVTTVIIPLVNIEKDIIYLRNEATERKEMADRIQEVHEAMNSRLVIIETEIKQLNDGR